MVDEVTPTGRTILGFLAAHPRSGYEIREAARRAVSYFWGVSDGQLYPQLKLLAAGGLIEAVDEGGGPRARQVWRLTAQGRRALLDWVRAPSAPLQIRDENLVKILFAAQLDPGEALRLVAERRQYFREFREHLEAVTPAAGWSALERAAALPTPDFIRGHGIGFAQAAIDWCDSLEAELRRRSAQ
ncbi:PadR family transcriptional regulator [Dactylosporangium vinaceum]|uniref:PadR family transcriptional regulator n=1 Tax=Dactylosporangium vinaceum TaxID=53362 RepID=A0ABV5MIT5_9ACTN|nr:PadR family transcriptional regulator [Dactylosporangium vinaceum]UAB93775.1 PadR family transcriptional regulator [Dactylosporangium vinaceum]